MNFNFDGYREALDDFSRQCPMWAEDIVECIPRHGRLIRVFLRNGDCVDYDNREGTYRYITKDKIPQPDAVTEESCRMTFSMNLTDLMRMRGVGQSVLSERTGISQGMISRYLKQKATPSATAIKKIALALGCSTYELLD